MSKKYSYGNCDKVIKEIELFLEALPDINSVRELWNIVGQTLSKTSCVKVLFYCSSLSLEDQPKTYKIQSFQGYSNVVKTDLAVSEKDVLRLIQNIASCRSIQLGPVKLCSSSSLKSLENKRLRDAIFTDLGEIYVSEHFGPNGFAGFTIFKFENETGVDTNLTRVILTSFFSAIQKKHSDLELDEIRRRVSITPRENDVLQLLSKGKSNVEIAENLEISKYTINSYVKVLSLKLNSKNRTVTALRAIALGLSKA